MGSVATPVDERNFIMKLYRFLKENTNTTINKKN